MPEPRTRLRIVHAVVSLNVGGLERVVIDLVRAGTEAGHRVSVLCLEHPGTLAPQAEAAGAEVLALHKPPGRLPGLTAAAAKVLAPFDPDVIHTHQVGPLWYLGPAAGRAVVLHTEHTDNVRRATGRQQKLKVRWLWNRAARHAAAFCCVSDDVARSAARYRTVPKRKLAVVPNGIDTARFQSLPSRKAARAAGGIPAQAFVVGTVGRLVEVKRQDLLLRAVANLPEVHVALVGDGPERPHLEQLAANLGITSRTHFLGYRADPEQLLPALDVFALTSRTEGLPLALLEAWAARLPIVCTAVGGIPKVVTQNVNGLLIPAGDELALVTELKRLASEPGLRTQLGEAGHQTVQANYSLARMASDYESRYRALIVRRI